MKCVNILGLILNVVGTLLVFVDSWRKSVRLTKEDESTVTLEVGDTPGLGIARHLGIVGIGLVLVGFAAQLLAAL
jgi:hypothetical protein